MTTPKNQKSTPRGQQNEDYSQHCGIIMPIAPCQLKNTDFHKIMLEDIRKLIEDAISDAGLTHQVVWESNTSTQIKQSIINNIRNFPYAVCVICGLNPNVMFELGLAVAFNKHIVILTDDTSGFPFDISDTSCIKFPIPQSYTELNMIKGKITKQLEAMRNQETQTFLSHFGPIKPAEDINPSNIVNLTATLSDLVGKVAQISGTIDKINSPNVTSPWGRNSTINFSNKTRYTEPNTLAYGLRAKIHDLSNKVFQCYESNNTEKMKDVLPVFEKKFNSIKEKLSDQDYETPAGKKFMEIDDTIKMIRKAVATQPE